MTTQTFDRDVGNLPDSISRDLKDCMKKPITVRATQMYGEFRVRSMEGDYAVGKPGDYLMCGIVGEMYICDKDIFEQSYDLLGV